ARWACGVMCDADALRVQDTEPKDFRDQVLPSTVSIDCAVAGVGGPAPPRADRRSNLSAVRITSRSGTEVEDGACEVLRRLLGRVVSDIRKHAALIGAGKVAIVPCHCGPRRVGARPER